jgi:hypothetical protein
MQKHLVVVLLSSLSLFACAAATTEEAKSASDPWADFKGTYSQGAGKTADNTDEAKPSKKDAKKDAKAKSEPAPTEKTEEAAAPSAKKAASRGTVNGESLSTISVDTLTDVSTGTLKGKFLSNSVVTGAQYELVQVQLKGATVMITRPAEKPAPHGPAIASPKAKNAGLSKSDAGWYDESADVLVVVNAAGKKAAAQKALAALVKH